MKKFLLLFCALPLMVFAQIAPVQTYDNPYEAIGRIVLLEKKTSTYYLRIQSDNQFEDHVFLYKIGSTGKEAATSLANLYAVLKNDGQLFDVGQYQFMVRGGFYIQLIKSGDFYYTAGNYTATKYDMRNSVKRLITDYNAACGDVIIIADDLQYGKLNIECKYYNMTFPVEAGTNLLSLLSRNYGNGENLSVEDAMVLRQAAIDGRIDCPLLKTLCKQ